jgi:ParB-like chromosome segregation protein Spo0J
MNSKHAGLTVKKVDFQSTAPHPDNPRIHSPEGSPEYERLKASLASDYFDPLIYNIRNGMMVSGHFRRTILMAEGFESADMVVVDWPEEKHKARMIAANELLGTFDDAKLAELLRDASLDRMLTGLTDERMDEVLGNVISKSEKPLVMPPTIFQVVVECKNEEHQQTVFEQFSSEGLKVQLVTI